MPVEVSPVTTKSDQKAFLNLPWQLYQNDSHWVPPLRQNQKELCGFAKHPFYETADSTAYLAKIDGKPVGRVLAITNHTFNELYQSKFGFFGFFESVENAEVANALFDAVKKHHRQLGHDTLRGPTNPSMNYECGLLVDGFDSPPVFMMTYNPPYYQEYFESNGMVKSHDLYAYLGHVDMLKDNEERWAFINEKLSKKVNFTMRQMERPRFDEELRGFLDVYNRALPGSWGFVPISQSEMDHMAAGLRHLIVPDLTGVVEVDGKRIGVTFGMLDYNDRIKKIDGKLFPFGFFKLLFNRKKIKRVRLISTNVVPEYQKNKGIGLTLFSSLIPNIYKWGIEECEFSWVLESNRLSRATLERCGTVLYKTYRMYDSEI